MSATAKGKNYYPELNRCGNAMLAHSYRLFGLDIAQVKRLKKDASKSTLP
jgi:hypothetical protein